MDAEFVELVDHQRLIVDYIMIAGAAVLLYDFFLMVRLEIEVIWCSKWTTIKALYLCARHIPILNVYFILRAQLSPNATKEACVWNVQVGSWLLMVAVLVGDAVLAIRTWAVWNRNIRIGICLVFLQISSSVLYGVFVGNFKRQLVYLDAPYPGYRGCFFVQNTGSYNAWYMIVLIYVCDVTVFGIMAIGAFKAYRLGHESEFAKVVYRDAIKYYILLLCITLSAVIAVFVLPTDLQNYFFTLKGSLLCIFMSRIIINIRVAGKSPELVVGLWSTQQRDQPELFRTMSDSGGTESDGEAYGLC